LTEKDKSS